jgi:hypothetical protein
LQGSSLGVENHVVMHKILQQSMAMADSGTMMLMCFSVRFR